MSFRGRFCSVLTSAVCAWRARLASLFGLDRGSRPGRQARRSFRPALDGGRLEVRLALSTAKTPFVVNQFLLTHPEEKFAKDFNRPQQLKGTFAYHYSGPVYNKGYDAVQNARGGQSVIVAQPDGSRFRLSLSQSENLYDGGLAAENGDSGNTVLPSSITQAQGTIRAYALPGGQIGLILDGTSVQTQMTVDPLPFTQRKGYAHSFSYAEGGRTHVLNVGALNVTSGQIGGILGYHSAELSGPLTVGGPGVVDRIALQSVQPGGVIGVGGTLNTLDVLNDVDLTSGPGISIGRDLNMFNVGGNVLVANGANFTVGRDVGAVPQPPKGTAPGSNFLALNLPFGTNTTFAGNTSSTGTGTGTTTGTGVGSGTGTTTGTGNGNGTGSGNGNGSSGGTSSGNTGVIGNTNTPSGYTAISPIVTNIQGNLVIGPGSSFIVGRTLDGIFDVFGTASGVSRVQLIPGFTGNSSGQVIFGGKGVATVGSRPITPNNSGA